MREGNYLHRFFLQVKMHNFPGIFAFQVESQQPSTTLNAAEKSLQERYALTEFDFPVEL